MIKLLGAGEYVVQRPGENVVGHFGLAVKDYAHSTAPNRRYPDLITQRLLKAAMVANAWPYDNGELETLAKHCTEEEDAVKKIERQVAIICRRYALAIADRRAVRRDVSGSSDKGTWVRIFQPPIEGKLVSGFEGINVGHRLRVQLISVDVDRGYIDFKPVG